MRTSVSTGLQGMDKNLQDVHMVEYYAAVKSDRRGLLSAARTDPKHRALGTRVEAQPLRGHVLTLELRVSQPPTG